MIPTQNSPLAVRVHGTADLPVLIYLPGSHGDWTLAGLFRRALENKVRFVELAYPITTNWSLDDYASAVASALASAQIKSGWLLGESFGSQVLWAFLKHEMTEPNPAKRFEVKGIILTGGFGQYPIKSLAWLGVALCRRSPIASLFISILPRLLFFRQRHSSTVMEDVQDFVEKRRRPGDIEAIRHRLRLVAENGICEAAMNAAVPIYCLSGIFDLVAPWPLVNRWFQKNCKTFGGARIIAADHVVLATAPVKSARQVLQWLGM